ncbi:MAG: CDP-alcohol phosphatidyltransferase family protein [Actinobacteria bacterium]|uniref:Phosphatidylinositol phosphate synthase n=1 Tax=freshwater metagenome TaxID=449393 RepID=A0A6J6PE36_9ZZZZ|nr:CDP-alcohol phosphatidyltransferase family protein [Actinomycetota bacterium]
MGKMLQESLRAPVTRLITPICSGLLRIGISANAITAIGALGTIISALVTYTNGHFFVGTLLIIFFVLFDLLDGTIARLSQKGSNSWGALLDSTLDRLTDALILGSITWYLIKIEDPIVPILLIATVLGFLISYIKARSESLGIPCNGGFAERTERLIIVLATTGLAGLGIPYVLGIGFWILAIASVITVFQRLTIVYRGSK